MVLPARIISPTKIAALVAVTAVVVGVVYWGQPPGRRPAPVTATGAPAGDDRGQGRRSAPLPGPSPEAGASLPPPAGRPTGRTHDIAGAHSAALACVRALADMVAMEEADAVATQRAMASAEAAETLVADLRARLADLRRTWPTGSLTYRVAPLATRVVADGADAATVDVWYVGVVAGARLPTYEEWVTETYRLVWEGDDWRVAAHSSTPGPRPDPGTQAPATAPEVEARLSGFEALR